MYIGIDVGGTNLKAGLVDESGELLAVERMPLDFQGPEAFAAQLAALAGTVMTVGGAEREDVSYVGVGIPGAVRGGEILYTANIPMRNVPLETLFRRHLDLPVLLGNDADCAAVGEWLFGAGRGTRHFIVITLGTGVGGGVLRDVLAGDTPYIFVKHVYASASLAGALACVVLWPLAGEMAAMLCGSALVVAVRILSAHFRWNLPHAHD